MRKLIREKIHRLAEYIEIIIAVIIIFIVILSVVSMINRIIQNPFEIQDEEAFYYFLESALSLIVGIEFLKMIIIPTSQNVIETLLFAVARQIIIDHSTTVLIVGIISVFILFIVKKYFVSDFDEVESAVFSAKTLTTRVNRILSVNLPVTEENETLGDLFQYVASLDGTIIQPYAKVKINDTILTIYSYRKNQIRRIEVLKEKKEKEVL